MSTESILRRACELLREDRTVAALDQLLTAWEDCRSAELADRIERLGQQIDRSLPALDSVSRERWIDIASKRRAADLDRLLAAFTEAGSIPVYKKRVELLELFPIDPRMPAALLPVACQYSSYASDPLRTRVYRLVKKIGDPRSLALIDEQLAALEKREGLLRDKPRLVKLRDGLNKKPSGKTKADDISRQLAAIDGELTRLLAAPAPDERTLWSLQADSGSDAREQQLLARILADPQDNEARLVYGDCLAERGDPRGELIVLQMKEKLTGKQQRCVRQLVREHGEAWIRPLDLVVDTKTMRFQRGFLHECEVRFSTRSQKRELLDHPLWNTVQVMTARDDEVFLRHASHLKEAIGITPLGLSKMAALEQPVPLEAAAGAPPEGRKGRVGIDCTDLDQWEGAVEVGALTSLRALHLYHHGSVEGLAWLVDSRLGRQLTSIRTGHGQLLGWQRLMERRPELREVALQGRAATIKLVRERAGGPLRMLLEAAHPRGGAGSQMTHALEGYAVSAKLPELEIKYVGSKRLAAMMDGFRKLAADLEDLFDRIVLPDGAVHAEGDYLPPEEPSGNPELLEGRSPEDQLRLLIQQRPMMLALARPTEQLAEIVRSLPEDKRLAKYTDLAHALAAAARDGIVDAKSGWKIAAALREQSLETLSGPDEGGQWDWGHTEATLYHCLAGDWDSGLAVAKRIPPEEFPDDFLGHLNLVTAYRVAAVGAGADEEEPLPEYRERYDYYNYQNKRDLKQLLLGSPLDRLRRLCDVIHPWVIEDSLLVHYAGGRDRHKTRELLRCLIALDPERPLAIFLSAIERSPYDCVRVSDWDLLARMYDDRFTYRELDTGIYGPHLVEVGLTAAARLLPHVDEDSTAARLRRWLTRARAIDAAAMERLLHEPRFDALADLADLAESTATVTS